MNKPTEPTMINAVVDWLTNESGDDQTTFTSTAFDNLSDYHHSLGRSIRNHFALWQFHWEPQLVNGVDHSPDHPDAISARVIEGAWHTLQERMN